MGTHFLFLSVPSDYCWRVPLQDLVERDKYLGLIEAVERKLNIHYPEGAPWRIQQTMKDDKGKSQSATYAQVVKTDKRQPFHLDASALWYKMPDGRVWAPLSVVLHLNDGPATVLGPPPSSLFEELLNHKSMDPQVLADNMMTVLQQVEEKFVDARTSRNKAGHCLAFHAGEQLHAGAGHDKRPDPVFPSWNGRVVAYFFAHPLEIVLTPANKALLCHETPWGLMREGITKDQVILVRLKTKKQKTRNDRNEKQFFSNLHQFFFDFTRLFFFDSFFFCRQVFGKTICFCD